MLTACAPPTAGPHDRRWAPSSCGSDHLDAREGPPWPERPRPLSRGRATAIWQPFKGIRGAYAAPGTWHRPLRLSPRARFARARVVPGGAPWAQQRRQRAVDHAPGGRSAPLQSAKVRPQAATTCAARPAQLRAIHNTTPQHDSARLLAHRGRGGCRWVRRAVRQAPPAR